MMFASLIGFLAIIVLIWQISIITNEHIDERFDALERHLLSGKTIEELEDENNMKQLRDDAAYNKDGLRPHKPSPNYKPLARSSTWT